MAAMALSAKPDLERDAAMTALLRRILAALQERDRWEFPASVLQDSWHADDGVQSSSSSKSSTVGHTLLAASVSLFAWAFHALDVDVEEVLGAECDRPTAMMALLQQFLAAQEQHTNGAPLESEAVEPVAESEHAHGIPPEAVHDEHETATDTRSKRQIQRDLHGVKRRRGGKHRSFYQQWYGTK
eukprot:Skav202455  [mRNA]  locus=scaffold149:133454:134547:+ [translate_table: standard]